MKIQKSGGVFLYNDMPLCDIVCLDDVNSIYTIHFHNSQLDVSHLTFRSQDDAAYYVWSNIEDITSARGR